MKRTFDECDYANPGSDAQSDANGKDAAFYGGGNSLYGGSDLNLKRGNCDNDGSAGEGDASKKIRWDLSPRAQELLAMFRHFGHFQHASQACDCIYLMELKRVVGSIVPHLNTHADIFIQMVIDNTENQ